MCNNCGCNVTSGNRHLLEAGGKLEHSQGRRTIQVLEGLLDENDHQAMHNREHLDQHRVVAINLMSSPGSGKTRLLEACLPELAKMGIRVGVIEGDLETENDAARIRKHGVPVLQITTGMACHLDAHMVHNALHYLPLAELDLLFIENVGNLVCPASFDLGQHQDVVLLSATEGDDKPCKYPVMFRSADRVLISKVDLLAHFDDFDAHRAQANLEQLGLAQPAWQVSAKTGQGLEAWLAWLAELVKK
ncbi:MULTISPECIES: hydrogenase nickel incorporation protein HypB [Ferrimonas]|uniref:hydrogenase nickel incorporation protein HypB n=1 Tax=Ferrimonas TaxID=44011 RepID=UPI0004202760|nr:MULTISPECIES: hydrogenase nickel incorporation protein HypB [Ferrimonas]USD36396.1 hydrogenase nickel incorporation protein HypB [Ferrimonas sp. SCSIO 43195]